MQRFIFSFLFFFATAVNLIAQTQQNLKARAYYLASSGNDQNAGTKNSPWKTISKINTVQLKPGDKVLFQAGEVFKGTLKVDSGDAGMVNRPVIISTYGKGMAIIDAVDAAAIQLEKTTFIIVKKISLKGSGRKDGNEGDGLSVVNCSNIVVDDIDVNGFRNSGLMVYESLHIRITNVFVHDNGFAGISVSGVYQHKESCSDIYIGYCKAENNPGSPVILNNHSGNGIIAGECSKMLIEYCTATNNGWDMPRIGNGPVGIWCFEADSVIIQHCISYRNKTSKGGDDGGGFDLDGGVTNSVIQYCLSYENQGSGFGIFQYAGASDWRHNIIRYNISENDGLVSAAGAGIYIWNSSDDSMQFSHCLFYNNTIYNSRGAAISYAGQSLRKNFMFCNNIFIGADSLLKGKRASDVFLANCWWGLNNQFNTQGIHELNERAKKSGQEIKAGKLVGLNIKPLFKNPGDAMPTSGAGLKLFGRYKVAAHSPLRTAGLDLKSLYRIETGSIDFNGKPAPKKGIGASY